MNLRTIKDWVSVLPVSQITDHLEEKLETGVGPAACLSLVRAVTAGENNWKSLCKIFSRDYRDKDLIQQVHSISYHEAFKDKQMTLLEEVSSYCRQFSVISGSVWQVAGGFEECLIFAEIAREVQRRACDPLLP